MSKKAIVTAFNDNFKKLAGNLHLLIPENEKIETLKNVIHLGALAKPELYIKNFYEHITVPYKEQLDKKDDDFFLNLDLSTINIELVQDNMEDAKFLREKWSSFTQDQQKLLWQYMTVLQKLSERYAGLT